MRSAARATVAAFGALVGLADIEQSVGEVLQGNRALDAPVIESCPASEVSEIPAGEPVLTAGGVS